MSINISDSNGRFGFLKPTPWKDSSDNAYANANVPVNVFSGQGSGLFVPFKPQPLKNTYRRSLNFTGKYSSTRGTTIKDAIDAPGGAIKSSISCTDCSDSNVLQYNGKTNNKTQTPSTKEQCISAEKNARLRLRHKTVIPNAAGCESKCTKKPYFTRLEERRKYLKQDFKSNQKHNVCCDNTSDCYFCSVSRRMRMF